MRLRDWVSLGASVGMLAAWTGCTPYEREPVPNPGLTDEVGAFLENYLDAIDSRDTDRIRNAYVDDGRFVWIEEGEVRYRSAEEILASLEEFSTYGPIRTEMMNLTVVPVGETAAHTWATFTTTVGTGPGSFSFGGAISILTERIDGSWRVIGGHTSSPRGR